MSLLTRNTALYSYIDPAILFKSSVATSSTTSSITVDVLEGLFWTNIGATSATTSVSLLQGDESGVIDFISIVTPLVTGDSVVADISTLYEFGVLFAGSWEAASSTSNAAMSVSRELAQELAGASSTTDAALDPNRNLQLAAAASSSTTAAVLDIYCFMSSAIDAASSTAGIEVTRLVGLDLVASALSSTTSAALNILRELAQNISAASSSTASAMAVLRALSQEIAAASLTAPIEFLVVRPWISSVSASTSTTAPPLLKEISFGNMGSTWGEQSPTGGERARPWSAWKLSGGGDIEISGDESWGIAAVGTGDTLVSPVLFAGTGTHNFRLYRDQYGNGIGTVTLYIRGDTSSFNQLDGTPSWEQYTGPVDRTWTHVQMRIDG